MLCSYSNLRGVICHAPLADPGGIKRILSLENYSEKTNLARGFDQLDLASHGTDHPVVWSSPHVDLPT
jgi:hypothetical protein